VDDAQDAPMQLDFRVAQGRGEWSSFESVMYGMFTGVEDLSLSYSNGIDSTPEDFICRN
jgi:hypothetical protein